jgi:hypothetical protein
VSGNWRHLLVAAFLTAAIFSTTPVDFKTLNDEPVLLSVSQSLLYFRTPHEINEGMNYWGSYSPLTARIPIRPLLFPFLLQLFHQIVGYHYFNAFILNALFLFLLFSGVGIGLKKVCDRYTSYAAMVLCAAPPVISIYATGGGYDIMATVFLCLALVLLFGFLHEPTNDRFALLWLTLILLANIRHESCAYSIVIGAVTLTRLNKEKLRHNAWLLLSAGLFMMPYIWQRLLVTGRYENPAGTSLFSVEMFVRNGYELLSNFLNIDFYLPYCGVLNVVAVVALGLLVFNFIAGRLTLKPEIKSWGGVLLVCLAINLVIILAHHAGTYSHATQARFFIVFSMATALSPILLKLLYHDKIASGALLWFSIVVLLLYHPISMKNDFISTLMENRSNQAGRTFLTRQMYNNPLLITKWPVQYTSLGYSAIRFEYANKHKDRILSDLRNHFFDSIVVFQQKTVEGHLPLKGQTLNWAPTFKRVTRNAVYYDKIYLEISCIEAEPS